MLIYKQSKTKKSFKYSLDIYLFRANRNDRDARVYESRFKQYENEISDLKARYDSIVFDASRRIEENEVVHPIIFNLFETIRFSDTSTSK
jgi:hypothetical protein